MKSLCIFINESKIGKKQTLCVDKCKVLWLHRFDMLFVMQTLGGSFLAFCSHFGHHNHKTVGKNTKKVKFREDLSRFEVIILVKTVIHKLFIAFFPHSLSHGSIHKWCLCYVTWEKLIFNDLSKLMLLVGGVDYFH